MLVWTKSVNLNIVLKLKVGYLTPHRARSWEIRQRGRMDLIHSQWVRDFSFSFSGLWNSTQRICQQGCASSQTYRVPSLPVCKTSCTELCSQIGLSDAEDKTVAYSHCRRTLLEQRDVTWQRCDTAGMWQQLMARLDLLQLGHKKSELEKAQSITLQIRLQGTGEWSS